MHITLMCETRTRLILFTLTVIAQLYYNRQAIRKLHRS
jgi:hypothetical protein